MIILISGSINSGKTTVARLLAKTLPKMAYIEVDCLREFIRCLPLDASIPLNLENAARVAETFIENGLDVVIDYPLGDEDHCFLIERLRQAEKQIHTFVLGPDLTTALTNRGGRELDHRERDRIREQYADGRSRAPFGDIIDNGKQTPEETVRDIVNRMGLSPR